MSDDLEIVEPTNKDMEFYEGENKTVKYHLKNNSDFAIRDIDFHVKSIKPDGEGTEKKYATVGPIPKVILSKDKTSVDVNIRVPTNYGEYITKDGVKKLVPFRLIAVAKGTKFIGE